MLHFNLNDKMKSKLPKRFWFGLVLIVLCWYVNWNFDGLRTHLAFFPMWLGFALVVDGLVYFRKGSSLYSRNKLAYTGLFLLSIPLWWLFELFNSVTRNWQYLGREHFTDFEFFILASLSFSTVVPSVFGSAELVSTFWRRENKNWTIKDEPKTGYIFITAGILMLILLLFFPMVFYVFIWMIVFLIVEGINILLKNKSIITVVSKGNWQPVFSLWVGCVICGFFWEMWNYYSYPKWIYDVPGVNFLHVFEMPLLGYLGYIPFSLELYSVYKLIAGLINKKSMQNYFEL